MPFISVITNVDLGSEMKNKLVETVIAEVSQMLHVSSNSQLLKSAAQQSRDQSIFRGMSKLQRSCQLGIRVLVFSDAMRTPSS